MGSRIVWSGSVRRQLRMLRDYAKKTEMPELWLGGAMTDRCRVLARASRAVAHLRNRTLMPRLRQVWQDYVYRRRAVWWQTHVGKREFVDARVQGDVRMRLYFSSRVSRSIYCGNFERAERQFLQRFLRPGDVFFDVGAHVGLFALIAAKRVGRVGHVYAFEPSAQTFERLRYNVEMNSLTNVSAYPVAMSDGNGSADLFVSSSAQEAWNSLVRPHGGGDYVLDKIETMALDDFVEQHGLAGRIAMMKVDVEGWETKVVSGARRMLARADAPVLQMEFTDPAADAAGASCRELYRALAQLGYRMHVYNVQTNRLVHDPLRERYPYVNLIACKRPDDAQARIYRRWIG